MHNRILTNLARNVRRNNIRSLSPHPTTTSNNTRALSTSSIDFKRRNHNSKSPKRGKGKSSGSGGGYVPPPEICPACGSDAYELPYRDQRYQDPSFVKCSNRECGIIYLAKNQDILVANENSNDHLSLVEQPPKVIAKYSALI